jgi:hypothetical protein
MVIRRLAFLAGSLLLVLPFSTVTFSHLQAGAPTPSAQEMNFTLEGKITEKTANKLTVNSSDNIIFHVSYDDKTEIKKKDGSPGTAQDLHIGLRVSVAGDLTETGEIKAKKIEIEGSEKQ